MKIRNGEAEDDQRLDQELRLIDDLQSNALRLIRATGIRIGECIDLPLDCLRQVGEQLWAVHVPLGKLHTERFVPVDDDIRYIVARIPRLLTPPPLRASRFVSCSPSHLSRRCPSRGLHHLTRIV